MTNAHDALKLLKEFLEKNKTYRKEFEDAGIQDLIRGLEYQHECDLESFGPHVESEYSVIARQNRLTMREVL